MRQPRMIQILALVCSGGLLFGAATRIPGINEGRKDLNMMGAESPLKNAPPEYAFAIQAFGAFRGLIVDIAFIRAEKYKEDARYFDAMQLADWICKLQPYFPTVWEFHAWNMSWNISVTTHTPEERWNWVYNGVQLLRDEGIPYNPRAINLYKQLAWTYNNKMGEITDQMHYAYKCNWAWRMHLLLGPPNDPLATIDPATLTEELAPDTTFEDFLAASRKTFEQNELKRQREAREQGRVYEPKDFDEVFQRYEPSEGVTPTEVARRAALEQLRPIHDAPDRLEDVLAAHPAAAAMVGKLRAIGVTLDDEPLEEDSYWSDMGLAFRFFAPYRRLMTGQSILTRVSRRGLEKAPYAEQAAALDEILGTSAGDPAGDALVRWLQKKVLADVYKMETGHMMSVIREFGPVDWRAVDAISLYWVTKGLVAAGDTLQSWRNDKANTARIMFFSLRNLFLRNSIVFEPYPEAIHLSYLNLGRDMNFIEAMHQTYVVYGKLYDIRPANVGPAGDTFRIGHINFLTEAIRLLYLSGREDEAQHYYSFLQDNYTLNDAGEVNQAFTKTLENFVMDNFRETLGSTPGQREIRLALNGLMFHAFERLARGDMQVYLRYMQRAQELHAEFMKDKGGDVFMESKQLRPFREMQIDAFLEWFARPPISPMQTIQKIRLWRAAPLYLRQGVYDELLPALEAECDAWDFELARAFPEPKNMAQYREQRELRRKDPMGDPNVITLPKGSGG